MGKACRRTGRLRNSYIKSPEGYNFRALLYKRKKYMKKKRLIIILIILAVVLGLPATFIIYGINKYIDTHSWATIAVDGAYSESDVEDAIYYQQECLKGDYISMGSVDIKITEITHDGTVTFKVVMGELKDESGNIIKKDTLELQNKKRYKTPEGYMQLEVVSKRYE